MTTPTEAPREALPEPLKAVAWLTSWPKDRVRPAGSIVSRLEPQQKFDCNKYDPLVRLTDAQSALESERQAHAAEVERLRGMLQLKFTEEQCIDLFAAALYISARGDETSVLSEENAERIAEFLCDLSGVDMSAAIARGKT